MLQSNKLKDGHPCYDEDGIIKRYMSDNKQVFETSVMPLVLQEKYENKLIMTQDIMVEKD